VSVKNGGGQRLPEPTAEPTAALPERRLNTLGLPAACRAVAFGDLDRAGSVAHDERRSFLPPSRDETTGVGDPERRRSSRQR
jgi:hypothetical protein